jgi:hypothetical protein
LCITSTTGRPRTWITKHSFNHDHCSACASRPDPSSWASIPIVVQSLTGTAPLLAGASALVLHTTDQCSGVLTGFYVPQASYGPLNPLFVDVTARFNELPSTCRAPYELDGAAREVEGIGNCSQRCFGCLPSVGLLSNPYHQDPVEVAANLGCRCARSNIDL